MSTNTQPTNELLIAVERELREFGRSVPEPLLAVPISEFRPLGTPDRRERERLARLGRNERPYRERNRERERQRPWPAQEPWTLHKQLWREQRDRDHALLDTREQALLEQQAALLEQLPTFERWLAELTQLAPEQGDWAAETRTALAEAEMSAALLVELWQRRRAAAEAQAQLLATQPALRTLVQRLPVPHNATAIARALVAQPAALPIEPLPVLVAALALQLVG